MKMLSCVNDFEKILNVMQILVSKLFVLYIENYPSAAPPAFIPWQEKQLCQTFPDGSLAVLLVCHLSQCLPIFHVWFFSYFGNSVCFPRSFQWNSLLSKPARVGFYCCPQGTLNKTRRFIGFSDYESTISWMVLNGALNLKLICVS